MEDTERLRSRMRERRRREVFEKAEKEEEREKAVFARFVCWAHFIFDSGCSTIIMQMIEQLFPRLERNRRWRARREDSAAGKKEGDEEGGEEEEDEKDEKEKRKRKNKEWRERRSASNSQVTSVKAKLKKSSLCVSETSLPDLILTYLSRWILSKSVQVDLTNASAPVPPLSSLLLTELTCPFCQVFQLCVSVSWFKFGFLLGNPDITLVRLQEDMAPPGEIWQCREGHSLCQKCRARPDMQVNLKLFHLFLLLKFTIISDLSWLYGQVHGS